jgi:hypothetical protein
MTFFAAPAIRRSYYEHDLAGMLKHAEELLCEISDFDPATTAEVVYLYGREKDDKTYGWFHLHSGMADSIDQSTTVPGDGTVPLYSAQNFLVSRTSQTIEVQADHTSIISSAAVLKIIEALYAKATDRADLETASKGADYASLLAAETAGSGNLISVSLDPTVWSRGDDKLAIEINKKALTAMGYSPADVATVASGTFDATNRAKLFAIAASSTDNSAQRLAWVGDVARSAYDAGQFQDAIQSSAFVSVGADIALPQSDPKKANLQKAATEVEGWAYLKGGNLAKFNEIASAYATKYAVTKDDFKEPTPMVSGDKPEEWYLSPGQERFLVYAPDQGRAATWSYSPTNRFFSVDRPASGSMVGR